MRLLFWPFQMIWSLIGFLFKLFGRLMSAIIGVVFMITGAVLTFTIVGSFIGIPLIILGLLLLIRSIF